MFVVSRKSEESVIVDGFHSPERSLKVTVLEVRGGRVKLGIEVNAGALDPINGLYSRSTIAADHAVREQEVWMR